MSLTIIELAGIAGGIAATVMALIFVINLILGIRADRRDSTDEAHKGRTDAGITEGALDTQIVHIISSLNKLTNTVDGIVEDVSGLKVSVKTLEANSSGADVVKKSNPQALTKIGEEISKGNWSQGYCASDRP